MNFGQQPQIEFAGQNPQQQQFYGQNYYIVQQQYQPQQVQQVQQQNSYQQKGPSPMGGMPPADNGLPNKSNVLDLKKTKLCPNLKQGHCPKGDRCNFAHSQEELRMKPNLMKTKMCPNMQKKGGCEFGDSCNFAHSELELRSTPNIYKTSLCNNFMAGECKLGDLCRFAHGEIELRKKVQNMPQNDFRPQQQFNRPMEMRNGMRGGQQGGRGGGQRGGGRPQGGQMGGYQQNQQVLVQPGQMQPQQAFVDDKGMIVYPNAQPMMINGQQGAYVMAVPGENGIQAVQTQYAGFQGEVGQNSQNHIQAVQMQGNVQQGVQGVPGYAQISPQQLQGGQPQVQILGQQGQMIQQIPQNMPVNIATNVMK